MGSRAFTANLHTCLFCTFNFQLHATGIYISSILNMGFLFPNHESSLVWCQNLELNMIQDSTVLRTIGSNQAGTWGWITARICAGYLGHSTSSWTTDLFSNVVCKIMESVCRSTVCKLNTDAASRHLGKYLKSNLETKQSTCACLVVNIRKKLSFISRRVGYVNTVCITCNLISDKNVCQEHPPVMFYIFKYLQSSSFLLLRRTLSWAETCNSFVGCDIFSSRSTSKILGVPKTIIFTGVV